MMRRRAAVCIDRARALSPDSIDWTATLSPEAFDPSGIAAKSTAGIRPTTSSTRASGSTASRIPSTVTAGAPPGPATSRTPWAISTPTAVSVLAASMSATVSGRA